jgi:hypothetical protein
MIGFREALAKFEEAKVKRDKNGKFANKYGNVKEGRLASAMARAVKTSGGFTLDDRTGRGVPDGYSVGVFPQYSGVFDVKQFSKGAAKKWLAQHRKLIKDDRIMVGGWHDTDSGKVWLDLVRVYPKNQKDIALGVGRKRNQIAIADLGAISRGDWDNAIINTGGSGLAKRGGRFFLLKGSATPEELFNAVHNRTITKLFSEILKAKSQYAIGKHPNSHRKRGGSNAAEGEEPADTQEGIKAGRSFYNSEYKRLNSTPFTKKDQLEVVRHLASAGFGQTALFKVYVQQLKNRMALGSKSPDGSVLNFYSSLYRNKPEMNTTLRTRRLQDLQDDPADGKKGVGAGRELLAWRSTLDYMLNTYGTPTKKPMLALRGVHSKDALEVKTPTGVRYLDRGFTSVSVNGSHREFGDTSVMVRIPKGVRILPVERQGFDFGELLLPRNAEYRTGAFHNIRSVRPTPKRNKTLPDRATERYVELLGVRNIKKAESFDELFKAFNEADHPRDEDGQFASKMSSEDAEELRGYSTTGGTYSKVNAGLRSNKDMSSDPTVAALDRAFATHAEAAPSVLYRGMSGYELEELDLRVGREFTDPAFVSTTSQKKSATKFATAGEMKLNGEAVGILFKINAKSAPSLDMNRFSNYEEQETLLNRGTRFRVTSVKPGVAGRTLASVTLTVVPNR